jgi:hypothetical protein
MKRFELLILSDERERQTRAELKKMREELEYMQAWLAFERVLFEQRDDLKAGFDQNQPRVPAGSSTGGRWAGDGSNGAGSTGGGASNFSEIKPTGTSDNLTGVRTTHFKDLDGKIRKIPEGVGNPKMFQKHVDDHARDFNAKSGKDYVKQALKFRDEGIENKFPMITDKDEILRIYDPETNKFGAYNKDGTFKTYMFPKDNDPIKGYEYYENAVDKALKMVARRLINFHLKALAGWDQT